MGYVCEHCSVNLATKASLVRHQKCARACLRIQGKEVIEHVAGSCPGCGKNVTRSGRLKSHMATCPMLKLKTELEQKHAAELASMTSKITELAQELAQERRAHEITLAKLEVQTANVSKQSTTNITVNLGELTPEVGLLLAEAITPKEFWEGQRGIGRALRDLRDSEERPFYAVKDENRLKYEVWQGGKKLRDDRAEKIIKTVEGPVKKKISAIGNDLVEEADKDFVGTIMERTRDCLNFASSDQNSKFLQSLSSKNE